MKKKFYNQEEIRNEAKELESNVRILKEISEITDKIPLRYITDICNSQWQLIKHLVRGIIMGKNDYCDFDDDIVECIFSCNGLSEEERRELYNQWEFLDRYDYCLYEIESAKVKVTLDPLKATVPRPE